MDILLALVVIVPFILLLLLISVHIKASSTQDTLKELKQQLNKLSEQIRDLELTQKGETRTEEKIVEIKNEEIPVRPSTQPQPQPLLKPGLSPAKAIESEPVPEEADDRLFTEEKSPSKTNTDWERFIGENLANKIGIAVLVLGISFFVKYAIDKNWINETGRVAVGLLTGGILLGIAHYIRKSYRSFSSVLMGGGLTVFYFTIAFAFHQYHLINQQVAFIIMVIITAIAVLISLYYDRQELAVLATIGGFITPFLVTTGQENYIALFTYLSILNAGMMVLSWFKRWKAINIITLIFTIIIYGAWLIRHTIFEEPETLPYRAALFFGTLFYVMFIAMNIINNLRSNRKFGAFDFIIVLTVNFFYYTASMYILAYHAYEYRGIFTASLGILNLIIVVFFYRRKSIDRNFVSLLIGLALLFISLIAPVEFKGNTIVLFWAAEAVVLFWLYQRSRIVHLKFASLAVSLLMIGNLLLTWMTNIYTHSEVTPVILNKNCITGLAAAISLFIYHFLLKKEKEGIFTGVVTNSSAANAMLFGAVVITYLAGALEIFYQFNTRTSFSHIIIYPIYLQLYSFAAAIVIIQVFKKTSSGEILRIVLSGICLGLYLFNLKANSIVSFQLVKTADKLFIGHWFATVLLLWLLIDLDRFFFHSKNELWKDNRPSFTWAATASIILVLSLELYHIILWMNYGEDWAWWENLYYKAGLTILWGICSFVLMWLGMKNSFRPFRIISLSLFTLTLAKLFAYDIRNIPPGGKIAAFILLGVLLLTVSFMYQRLKKIIIDNTAG